MKRLAAIILSLIICISLACCAREGASEATTDEFTTQATTKPETTFPAESTTKQPEKSSSLAISLREAVESALDGGKLDGEFDLGSFNYKNHRSPSVVYQYEYTDELEAVARANAEKLVDEIKGFYNDEITLYDFVAEEIGSGDNGVDSVTYKFYYINTQNQILTIYADSDGFISYVNCAFTW